MHGSWVFSGLPAHALLVHFTILVIPAAALALVLAVVWSAARHRLGIFTPVLALAALASVPLTVQAGKWLYERVEQTPAVQEHEANGTSLLPWVIALFAVAALHWAWYRFGEKQAASSGVVTRRTLKSAVAMVLKVAALASTAGAVATVVRIGETGTTAVWQGNFDN